MSKNTASQIELLKFKDLVIENLYSGRTEKDINENAKSKAKELEAAGGWNPAMPGQYFVGEDGKRHLLAGFCRVKASMINGEDSGYFVEVKGDEVGYLLACETTNSVAPLSPLSRGARYSELRQGAIADDFDGAIADPKEPKHWKRMPMNNQEIAERIGKSGEWVRKCIAIFEAPPEIRDMLESDKIATTVVEQARVVADKYHNGSEVKQIAMCRKAFAHARSNDKNTATKQDFEAIREDFIPPKKLIADAPTDPSRGDNDHGSQPEAHGEAPSASAGDAGESQDAGESEQKPLFESEPETQPKSKTSAKKTREWGIALILKIDEEDLQLSMSDDDAGKLWDRLIEEGAPI